jgi:hypothetical protein
LIDSEWIVERSMPGLTREEKRHRKTSSSCVALKKDRPKKKPRPGVRTWDESFLALVEYKKQHGNCGVAKRDKKYPSLRSWVQRQQRRKLTKQQRDKLDKLGFEWETLKEKQQCQWDEMYQWLIEFKETHGHPMCR